MNRRHALAILAGCTLAARHSRASTPRHVGFVSGDDRKAAEGFLDAFREGLAGRGYHDPETLVLTPRYADFTLDRIPALVAEIEQQGAELIVTHAAATPIVVRAQREIPVVYEFSADPIVIGIARDLAHPLFNATGVTLLKAELNGKRLEFLHEINPEIRRVAVIANPLHAGEESEREDLASKAEQLHIRLSFFPTPNRAELERALEMLSAAPPQAIVAFSEGFIVQNRHTIINFAMSRQLPVVSGWAVMARSGALFTYGPRLVESYRRPAYYVDRILQGAKAPDLPIERPTSLELVVNLNSAKTLGITVPKNVLTRADHLID